MIWRRRAEYFNKRQDTTRGRELCGMKRKSILELPKSP